MPTKEPITVGGWYALTEGGYARIEWVNGRMREMERADRIPSAQEVQARMDRDLAEARGCEGMTA